MWMMICPSAVAALSTVTTENCPSRSQRYRIAPPAVQKYNILVSYDVVGGDLFSQILK